MISTLVFSMRAASRRLVASDVEIAAGERLAHADAAPGMNGDAMTVRGGDAGRGGIGVVDALPLEVADVAIDRMGLAAAGLAGEEDGSPRS